MNKYDPCTRAAHRQHASTMPVSTVRVAQPLVASAHGSGRWWVTAAAGGGGWRRQRAVVGGGGSGGASHWLNFIVRACAQVLLEGAGATARDNRGRDAGRAQESDRVSRGGRRSTLDCLLAL